VICEADNRVMKRFRCKQVICAAPLAISRTIAFTNISLAKKLIIDNQLRTNSVKSFMVVKTPFWRKDSDGKPFASGDCLFSEKHHVNMCHDISPLD
jgi:monoamine oxidase